MKGAYLLSQDLRFFGEITEILVGDGATGPTGKDLMVQLRDPVGRIFTIFGNESDKYFLEEWFGPLVLADDGVKAPDMRSVAACSVECRWSDLFVDRVSMLARQLTQPMWVLDEADVLWDASRIDVDRLAL